jgi:hypothetical protein
LSDSLRRVGYYHDVLRGKSTKKAWEKIGERGAADTMSVHTLIMLLGCDFADEFSLGDARVARISARELEGLFPRKDVCESFHSQEDPRRWHDSTDQWFIHHVHSEPTTFTLPAGDSEIDFYEHFLFQEGYWEFVLPIALYSSGFICLPLILQIEPGWTASKLRSEWPIVEWESNYVQISQSQHEGLVKFVSKIVDAFRLGDKVGFNRKIGIAAERYVRARLACGPNMDDDRYEQALLHLMIGLEVLLMSQEKGEGIMDKLSNRAARLAGRDDPEREYALQTMKTMYDQRSKLMHEGELNRKNPKSIPNMQQLCEIARRVLAVTMFFGDDPLRGFDKSLRSLGSSNQAQEEFLGLVKSVCLMTDAPRLTPPEK